MIAVGIVAILLAGLPVRPGAGGNQTGKAVRQSFEPVSREAERAREENRDDDAIRLYRAALTQRPQWDQGLWYLGTLLYEKEQYADALDVLRRFMTLRPDAGPGWALVGMSEFQTRQYAKALNHLQLAMSHGMADRTDMIESVFYSVAVLLTRAERYDDSMSILIAMVKSGQDPKPLIEPTGLAALRMPFLPAEIPADRREMVRQAGGATLALEAQRRDEAGKLFRGLTEQYPNEAGVHFIYGAFLLDENPELGVKEMKKELQVSPSSVPARLRLAEEYTKEQKLELALPLAQEAVKLDPKRASAHMMLGEVLIAKSDSTGGIQELETARQQDPETVRIHWDLLRAYTSAGRSDDAKREKEEIEKLSSARNQ